MRPSPVRDTLARYDRKRAGFDELLRALMNHADFHAPVALAQAALGGENVVLERLALYGDETRLPAGEAWLFTDDEAARAAVAQGAALGPYAARLLGCTLFEALECELSAVKVNPGSDPSQAWTVPQDTIRVAKSWARAVALERELASAATPTHPLLLRRLRRYLGYQILLHPNQSIVTAPGHGGYANPAVLFTAPDCADRCLAQMPLEAAHRLTRLTVIGEDLFQQMPLQGVDGMVFNPLGPGATATLPVSVCAAVMSAGVEG